LRKFIYKLAVVINYIFAGLLVFSHISIYISPSAIPFLALLGLLFPFLFFVNLIFLFSWIWKKKRLFLLSLIVILSGFFRLTDFFAFNNNDDNITAENPIKIMTYNVRLFDLYNWSGDTLIFKTENDAFDTLTVTYAGSYMHSDYYECDNGILYLRKIEEYSVSFENTNLNADINSIRVAQIGSTNDIRITHFFMSVYVDRTLLDGYIKDSYTYNDSTYYDVNVVENDSILIYINHTHGILAYKYKEQDMYNLHKSIRSSKK